MDVTIQLVKAGKKALEVLEVLDFDGRRKRTSPTLDRLSERRRHTAGRQLRAAVAGTVTELDTAVMHDLMQIVKKLGRGATKDKDDGLDRIRVTLELMDKAINKTTPRQPDHLIWLFNELYKGLEWVSQREWTGQYGYRGGTQ